MDTLRTGIHKIILTSTNVCHDTIMNKPCELLIIDYIITHERPNPDHPWGFAET